MDYILIEIDNYGIAYQEIANGQVIRYLAQDGSFLFDVVPIGNGSGVVDANPPIQSWMIPNA